MHTYLPIAEVSVNGYLLQGLAGLVLVICGKVALELVIEPADIYALSEPGRH